MTADDTNGLDKQSITADPYDSNLVYAVWDRFLSPPGINANDQGKINARSYVEQTWFSRTTERRRRAGSRPRVAYNPGTHAGTIGNIVVVLPNATHDLLDGMILFADHKSQLRGAAGRGRPLDRPRRHVVEESDGHRADRRDVPGRGRSGQRPR